MSGAYLDHAASTPLRPEAVAAMEPLISGVHGNPAGSHRWAREARRQLDDARDSIAEVVGAEPGQVVFTSGGTEADNLAVVGGVADRTRVLCSAVEHHAVLAAVQGGGGETVSVDPQGRMDLGALESALSVLVGSNAPVSNVGRDESDGAPALVSVMLANNETGAVNDLQAVGDLIQHAAPGAFLHTDAVAAAPWLDLARRAAPADLVTISGHKVGGPKGIGALIVRGRVRLAPQVLGGGQEQERRSGTPNLMGAVGFAAALVATASQRESTVARVEQLRGRLLAGLVEAIPGLVPTSPPDPADRIPGPLHLCVPGVDREALLFLLDQGGVAASWGSSCSSGATEPSHVLAAMGVPEGLARGALRLSLGWCSTPADVELALVVVPDAVARLRSDAASGGRPSGGSASSPVVVG